MCCVLTFLVTETFIPSAWVTTYPFLVAFILLFFYGIAIIIDLFFVIFCISYASGR